MHRKIPSTSTQNISLNVYGKNLSFCWLRKLKGSARLSTNSLILFEVPENFVRNNLFRTPVFAVFTRFSAFPKYEKPCQISNSFSLSHLNLCNSKTCNVKTTRDCFLEQKRKRKRKFRLKFCDFRKNFPAKTFVTFLLFLHQEA